MELLHTDLKKKGGERLIFEYYYDTEKSASRLIKDIQKIGTKKFPTQKEVRKSLYSDDWYRGKLFNAVIKRIIKYATRANKWEEIYIMPAQYSHRGISSGAYKINDMEKFIKKNIVIILKVIDKIEEENDVLRKRNKYMLYWYSNFAFKIIMDDIIKYKKAIKEKGNKK